MNPLKTIWHIARRDLSIELRRKEVLFTIIGFSSLVLSIFVFTIDVNTNEITKIIPAIFWTAIVFSSTIALGRRFVIELENRALDSLLLAPVSKEIIFLGKFIGNFILILSCSIIALPITSLLFNINIFKFECILICILISFGLSNIGTFFAIMTIKTRAREVILSLIFLPVISPLLFAGVASMETIIQNKSFNDFEIWIIFAIVYDLIFFLISLILFDQILQE